MAVALGCRYCFVFLEIVCFSRVMLVRGGCFTAAKIPVLRWRLLEAWLVLFLGPCKFVFCLLHNCTRCMHGVLIIILILLRVFSSQIYHIM